jgi:hypothetical protein
VKSAAVKPAVSPPGAGERVALSAIVLGFAASAWFCRARTVDDAYILFRYSKHLAEGAGLTFNPGEKVEGCSSILYALLLAPLHAAGLDLVLVSKVIGVLSGIATLLLVHRFARTRRPDAPLLALAPPFLFGTAFFSILWSVGGLETHFYTLLVTLGALGFVRGLESAASDRKSDSRDEAPESGAAKLTGRNAFLAASVWFALAAATRPEGAIFWGASLAFVLAGRRLRTRRNLLAFVLPFAVLFGAFFVARWAYYGDLLPNTYYAKSGGGVAQLLRGAYQSGEFLLAGPVALLLFAFLATPRAGRTIPAWQGYLLALTGAQIFFIVWAGGDGLYAFRFFVPLLPFVALLAPEAALYIVERGARDAVGARRLVALLSVFALAGGWSVYRLFAEHLEAVLGTRYEEGNVKLGKFLRDRFPRDIRIAASAAGAIPYYSDLHTIDMLGLNDRHIARLRMPETGWRAAGHGKWDNAYVLSREPEVIVVNLGYERIDPLTFRDDEPFPLRESFEMDRDLNARARGSGKYTLTRVRLDEGSVFALFLRNDFAARLASAGRDERRGAGKGGVSP